MSYSYLNSLETYNLLSNLYNFSNSGLDSDKSYCIIETMHDNVRNVDYYRLNFNLNFLNVNNTLTDPCISSFDLTLPTNINLIQHDDKNNIISNPSTSLQLFNCFVNDYTTNKIRINFITNSQCINENFDLSFSIFIRN